jgi:N-methylhydantoinase B
VSGAGSGTAPQAQGQRADAITTELIRNGLQSVAEQMKRALIRTAFSPIVYEALDFAVAIYDRQVRLLSQAPTFPLFMGTLSMCVEAAVEAQGGAERLRPGDILLYNLPYGTGSHQQDAAVVMPVFLDGGELIGYTAIKAHWLDIGAKDPYSTDTVDVFQEGTIFPGVKLYSGGELVDDVYRMALANSRVPKMVAGDINAEVGSARLGAAGLRRIVERYGVETFAECAQRMFEHGERTVRAWIADLPDGRFAAAGKLDSDGLDDEAIPFEITVEIAGEEITVDFTGVPDQTAGPINCPKPSTVSVARVAVAMLAGIGEDPNEGHFQPIKVLTREGSLFDPTPPAPCFLYGWPAFQAIEVIFAALATAFPQGVPACSGGDICSLMYWGVRDGSGEPWADGGPHPIGQGASASGDGTDALVHIGAAGCRLSALEVWEARNPWLIRRAELAPDSGGPGRHRGGLGVDIVVEMTEDQWITMCFERTKTPGWGLEGGLGGRVNQAVLQRPGEEPAQLGKGTRIAVPKGSVLSLLCPGGGGFGDPAERDPEAVRRDLRAGYVSRAQAEAHYPAALADLGDGGAR